MTTTVYTGTHAARPAPGTINDLYLPSDGAHLNWDSGALWVPWGEVNPMVVVPTAGWSWVNQGGAVIDESDGAATIYIDSEASWNLRCRARAMPGTPWTLTACLLGTHQTQVAYRFTGVFVRDSATGRVLVFGYGTETLYIIHMTDVTTFSATAWSQAHFNFQPFWLRVSDDGVNHTFYLSLWGQDWAQVHQQGRATWLANADQIGFFAQAAAAGFGHHATLLSWEES